MKTNAKIIALVFLVTSLNKSNAQFSTDLFSTIPCSPIAGNSLGGGLTILSKPIDVGFKKDPDFQLRFGGSFYGSSLMKNSIRGVPLEFPQTGEAFVTFKNRIYGITAITRFSRSYSKKIIPYADVFAGVLGISCTMEVDPYLSNSIAYKSTRKTVAGISEFNYGFSCGLIFSASKHVKFNIGLSSIYSIRCGQMVDVNSAHMESGTVVLNKIDPPSKMLMANVGIIFCFNKKGSHRSTPSYSPSTNNQGGYSGNCDSTHYSPSPSPSASPSPSNSPGQSPSPRPRPRPSKRRIIINMSNSSSQYAPPSNSAYHYSLRGQSFYHSSPSQNSYHSSPSYNSSGGHYGGGAGHIGVHIGPTR